MVSENDKKKLMLFLEPDAWRFKKMKLFRKNMQLLEENGAISTVCEDFTSGTSLDDDQMVLGQTYLFIQDFGAVLKYSDLRKAYQTIHTTNGFEDFRCITAETYDGQKVMLCKIRRFGKDDRLASAILEFLQMKNPNIYLGYKVPKNLDLSHSSQSNSTVCDQSRGQTVQLDRVEPVLRCRQCGRTLRSGVRFCANCGERVEF